MVTVTGRGPCQRWNSFFCRSHTRYKVRQLRCDWFPYYPQGHSRWYLPHIYWKKYSPLLILLFVLDKDGDHSEFQQKKYPNKKPSFEKNCHTFPRQRHPKERLNCAKGLKSCAGLPYPSLPCCSKPSRQNVLPCGAIKEHRDLNNNDPKV